MAGAAPPQIPPRPGEPGTLTPHNVLTFSGLLVKQPWLSNVDHRASAVAAEGDRIGREHEVIGVRGHRMTASRQASTTARCSAADNSPLTGGHRADQPAHRAGGVRVVFDRG